jgi:prevent-host-death family protein
MNVVDATDLKNRLGQVLDAATWAPVAVRRHGKVVAYLVPAAQENRRGMGLRNLRARWGRAEEDRLLKLCAAGDFRPSRWARAADRTFLAGVATMLASVPDFDRPRMLALAESLNPGMTREQEFQRWLDTSPLDPARFLPMLRERMRETPRA